MEPLINPIPTSKIEAELSRDFFLKKTDRVNNELYIINSYYAPFTMKEIGRLRELTFRDSGGGIGVRADIDNYDIDENSYWQLVLWDTEGKEIIGAYRFQLFFENLQNPNQIKAATEEIFNLSDEFRTNYLPYAMDLGRAFIQPKYQYRYARTKKSIYALNNLWEGIGAIVFLKPELKYLFGRIITFPSFDKSVRNRMLFFLKKHFTHSQTNDLIVPKEPIEIDESDSELAKDISYNNYQDDFKALNAYAKKKNTIIPPLLNAYLSLSPNMSSYGTTIDKNFGGLEETCLLIELKNVYAQKKERYSMGINTDQLGKNILKR